MEKDDSNIVHLPELSITKEKLKEIYNKTFKMNKKVKNTINETEYNPWAVCKSSTGKNTGKKLEKCIKSVKKKQEMSESGDVEGSLVRHKLTIKSSVDNMTPEKIKLTKKFIAACAKELGITKGCNVYLTGERGGPITTTASYNPGSDEIWIYTKNRNMLGDILRSTAHEIRHFKQKLDGVLNDKSGEDGSPHENEANSFSGLMIRKFGKQHREIYD